MSRPEASSTRRSSILAELATALAVVCLVIAGEYFFRHYVLFWLPVVGSLVVNDMLSLFLAYSLLLAGIGIWMRTDWRQELVAVWQAVQESIRSWNFVLWFVLLVLSQLVLSISTGCSSAGSASRCCSASTGTRPSGWGAWRPS